MSGSLLNSFYAWKRNDLWSASVQTFGSRTLLLFPQVFFWCWSILKYSLKIHAASPFWHLNISITHFHFLLGSQSVDLLWLFPLMIVETLFLILSNCNFCVWHSKHNVTAILHLWQNHYFIDYFIESQLCHDCGLISSLCLYSGLPANGFVNIMLIPATILAIFFVMALLLKFSIMQQLLNIVTKNRYFACFLWHA